MLRIDAKLEEIKVLHLGISTALSRCAIELRSFMRTIILGNSAIFRTVLAFHRYAQSTPRQICFDEPVTFRDAHNRHFPIHLDFINGWNVRPCDSPLSRFIANIASDLRIRTESPIRAAARSTCFSDESLHITGLLYLERTRTRRAIPARFPPWSERKHECLVLVRAQQCLHVSKV